MKVYVDADELYPVYSLATTRFGICDELDVDEKTYKRWVRAYAAFHSVQDEVKAALAQARSEAAAKLLAGRGAGKHEAESRTDG